ncbi:MAG: hypothetical protein U0166_11030 [Acidobacteriota bacterium]
MSFPRNKALMLAAGFAVALLAFRYWPTDARRVERCIRGAAAAIEREQILALAGYLSRDFGSDRGGYEEALVAVGTVVKQYDDIAIHFLSLEVAVNGTHAQAKVTVRIEGRDGQGGVHSLFGESDVLHATIGVKKTADGWRIDSYSETI